MHTNSRLRFIWLSVLFVLSIGMSCSFFSSGAGNSGAPDTQSTPPPLPTVEGVAQDNLPIPLPSDAANFTSSQGSFSYGTQLSVEDVAKFYQEKLSLQGWTIEQQGNMGGTLMWSISRENVTYLLNIMPSNGMTIVNVAPIK